MSDDTPPIYLDAGQPLERRVDDLLHRMTFEEKLGQLNMPIPTLLPEFATEASELTDDNLNEACEKLIRGEYEAGLGPIGGFFSGGSIKSQMSPADQRRRHDRLQRIAREETRLGIPLMQVGEGTHGLMAPGATVFPEGPALGAVWDMDLLRRVYEAVALESDATGVHVVCTLAVEPIRDPRLGRNVEAYTECPFLTREIAFAVVEGVQGDDLASAGRVGAALTCFPGQSEPESGIERGAMEMSERQVRAIFLPAWTTLTGPDGALAAMASYATIDGMPTHGSEFWLTDVLRGELDFEGVVLSEGRGFFTLQYEQIVETQKEAGALSLGAGVDVNITYEDAFLAPLAENVREGTVGEELIDRAVRRVLAAKFRLGLFDDAPTTPEEDAGRIVNGAEHLELALEAAREGIVLLKNEGELLPLSKDLKRVALIGPSAHDSPNLLGDYVVAQVTQPVETVFEAAQRMLGDGVEVVHEKGCEVTDDDDSGIAAAVAAAESADVAIVLVGDRSRWGFGLDGPPGTIGEKFDVISLDLLGRQNELIEKVHATGTPTIVVLVNGRALSIPWAAEHVPAIVEAFLPGERGGQAVVEVLFGDVNPSGRLPVTIPAHVGQLPAFYNHKPSKPHLLARWKGYVDGDGLPLYPFGHGLSYTSFQYSDLSVELSGELDAVAEVSATVRNVGERAGKEVVQLYVADRYSSMATPARELRGFSKVALEPGEETRVTFTLDPMDLALLDAKMQLVVEPGVFDIMVGASCDDVRLRGELDVEQEIRLPGAIPLTRRPLGAVAG